MEIPQIKDKITARAFALHEAIGEYNQLNVAKEYYDFIVGDAELPEVAEDPTNKVLNIWSKVKEYTNETDSQQL